MTTPSSPQVTPNYTKYNLRNKTLVNVKCCVCLESVHPSYAFFCRGCANGIVCVDCMKSLPKKSGACFVGRHDIIRANIKPHADEKGFTLVLEESSNNTWRPVASAESFAGPERDTNIREIAFLAYERYQKYGYGNKFTTTSPHCPCCRSQFTFLNRGYSVEQWIYLHKRNAVEAACKAIKTEGKRAAAIIKDKEILSALKVYCKNEISVEGNWIDEFSNYANSLPRVTNGMYPKLTVNNDYSSHRVMDNCSAIMAAASLTVPGVEPDNTDVMALYNEGQNIKRLYEEYTAKIKDLTKLNTARNHPLIKLFSTQEGRDSIVTETPVRPYVMDFIMCCGGLYTIGAAWGGKAKAKVKALPTSVEDVMKSFGSMTAEERALLAAELNAM